MGVTYQVAHILLWFGNVELHLVFDKELKTQVVLCGIKLMSLWDEGKTEEDWLFDTINLTAPHQWFIFVQIEIGTNKAIQLFFTRQQSCYRYNFLSSFWLWVRFVLWLKNFMMIWLYGDYYSFQVSFHITSLEWNMNHGSGSLQT